MPIIWIFWSSECWTSFSPYLDFPGCTAFCRIHQCTPEHLPMLSPWLTPTIPVLARALRWFVCGRHASQVYSFTFSSHWWSPSCQASLVPFQWPFSRECSSSLPLTHCEIIHSTSEFFFSSPNRWCFYSPFPENDPLTCAISFHLQTSYPPSHYLRNCPQRIVHYFTVAQVLQLGVICFFGFAPWEYVKLLFPLIIGLLIPIRFVFSSWLSFNRVFNNTFFKTCRWYLLPRFCDEKYLAIIENKHC